jgi:porin
MRQLHHSIRVLLLCGGLAIVAPTGPAAAQPAPSQDETTTGPKNIWQRDTLLDDPGGLRAFIGRYGITFGLQETSEVFGNATGGTRQGAVYDGATLMTFSLDADKALGWKGGALNISAYQIHGRGLSANNLSNLNTVSNIEADSGALLFELWYDQSFWDGMLDGRIGQQATDQEFMLTTFGSLFLNASFGWPTLPAVDLPSGGPAYPFATPGIRVKVKATEALTLLAGLYNGDPAGGGSDASGTAFRIDDGVFAIVESQYAINQGRRAAGLPGTYKIGGWYNSEDFADQRFDGNGVSLASPSSTGAPKHHNGNWGIYAIMDQLLFRAPGTENGGLGVFARALGAPGDRNEVSFFIDGGMTYKGVFPGRDDDTIGIGIGYARISDRARDLDKDTAFYSGTRIPTRDGETVLELTYQAQITPWWQIQPDFQYVLNPGGGILDPNDTGKEVGNAAVFGLRTTITF